MRSAPQGQCRAPGALRSDAAIDTASPPVITVNKKDKKQLDLARKKREKLKQLVSAAKKQLDDPAELKQLESDLAQVEAEIARLQAE